MWNDSLATLPPTRLGSIPIELILPLNVASQQRFTNGRRKQANRKLAAITREKKMFPNTSNLQKKMLCY